MTMRSRLPLATALALAACGGGEGPSTPFRDAGPMDGALLFDVIGFDVVRRDRAPVTRPEVIDFTDAEFLPAQIDVPAMDRPCATQLPGEYRFYAEGPALRFDDRITLSSPRRFRFERRVPGVTTPLVCETSIPLCGAVDAVDVDELVAALADPSVAAALRAPETLYGCDARLSGGNVLVIERLGNRAVVGDVCRVCMTAGCVPAPLSLQRLTDVLVALRDQELLRPVCRDIASQDAGPPRADATADVATDVARDVARDAVSDAASDGAPSDAAGSSDAPTEDLPLADAAGG